MPNDLIVFAGVVSFALVMGTALAAAILIPPYEIPPMEVPNDGDREYLRDSSTAQ